MASARDVAERSVLIKNMIEDMGEEAFAHEEIPIPNVSHVPYFLQRSSY